MKMVRLGEVLELRYGKALKESDRITGEIPVLGSGGLIGTHIAAITNSPTIVVGRKGSIGTVTWVDGEAWPIDTAYYVDYREEETDPRWSYWLLDSLHLDKMNKSAAVPGLNRDDVYRLQILFPPLEEQRRIAAILDKADAIRQKRRRAIAHLETLTQSIFHDMFETSLSRSWPTLKLGEVSTSKLGKMLDKKKSQGLPVFPYIRNANVQWFKFDLSSVSKMGFHEAELRKYSLQPGDVLMCEGGEPGRCAIWRESEGIVMYQKAIHRIRLASNIHPEYFTRYFKRFIDTGKLKDYISTSTISHLTAEKLKQVPVVVPPTELQLEFSSTVERVRNRINDLNEIDIRQNTLFASLQSRAFRGEL